MKKLATLLFSISFLLIISCKKAADTSVVVPEENETTSDKLVPDTHTSNNSLDWEGTYEGTLPCIDCDGIFTILILKNDNTYILNTTKLMDDTESKKSSEGRFSWDESGSIVALSSKGLSLNYKVGEDMVTLLNQDSEPMPESAIANYTLLKRPE